jgi:aspartyl-tRNA(Asn)/glutamyl-tRNA(Gln) amidotransferase subunit A
MPATVCGIAGLKPTYGLVSRLGVIPNSYSFDHCGPMAWTVEDCALMLQSVAGYDDADPASLNVPLQDYIDALDRSVRGLRIGLVRDWYEVEVKATESVIAAMDGAIQVLISLGCSVRSVGLPSLRDFTDCKTPISLAEIYAIHEKDLKTRPRDFGHSLRWRIMPGALIRAEDYIQAMRWRTELMQRTLAVFEDIDLLVTAGSFGPAPTLAPDEPPTFIGAAVPSITTPFNLTGMPALSVCNGFDAAGLPLGMQIAGRPLDEARVLALGHAFERATDFRSRRPEMKKPAAQRMATALQ